MSWRWWRSQSAVTCRNTISVTAVVNFPPSQGCYSSSLPCAVALFRGWRLTTPWGTDKSVVIIHLHPVHKPFSVLHSFLFIPFSLCLSICLCACHAAALSQKNAQTHKQCSRTMSIYNMRRRTIWSNNCISSLSYIHFMALQTDVVILPGCTCIWSCVTTVSMYVSIHTYCRGQEHLCMHVILSDSFSLRLTEGSSSISNAWICCLTQWLLVLFNFTF